MYMYIYIESENTLYAATLSHCNTLQHDKFLTNIATPVVCLCDFVYLRMYSFLGVLRCITGWLRLVGSLKLQVSFAKEPYKRDYILQKRPIIFPHKTRVCGKGVMNRTCV